jgi:hypothetical protein
LKAGALCGALGAADFGEFDVNQVAAAKGGDFHPAIKAQ